MTLFGMTPSMKSWAVIVFVALLVGVALAVFLVASPAWAAFYEWMTHPEASPCACVGD